MFCSFIASASSFSFLYRWWWRWWWRWALWQVLCVIPHIRMHCFYVPSYKWWKQKLRGRRTRAVYKWGAKLSLWLDNKMYEKFYPEDDKAVQADDQNKAMPTIIPTKSLSWLSSSLPCLFILVKMRTLLKWNYFDFKRKWINTDNCAAIDQSMDKTSLSSSPSSSASRTDRSQNHDTPKESLLRISQIEKHI